MDSSEQSLLTRLLDNYRTRVLLCIAGSVGVVLLIVHLPLHQPVERVGWYVTQQTENPLLTVVDIRQEEMVAEAPIQTQQQPEPEPEPEEEIVEEELEEATVPDEPPELDRTLRMVYEKAEQMPEVQGGITNYYLNIEYPRAAILAGIEGRLLLSFVVEPSGRATNIQVRESLHPLCDSAAVRALRRTRFVPGEQAGRRVPVRMELPVRFQIVREDPVASTENSEQ